MTHNQNNPGKGPHTEASDGQLRSLILLFNWLVGEVITARIMVLRLATDLVRTGTLPVEDLNGMPLSQEIIDSVMSNFPTDPLWQSLGDRLRSSLDTLRNLDLRADLDDEFDEDELLDEDLDALGDLADEEDLQVIYRNPDHGAGHGHGITPTSLATPFRSSGRDQN